MMGLAEEHTTYLFGGPVSLAPEALRKMGSLEHLEDNDGWLRRSVGPVNLTLIGMGFTPALLVAIDVAAAMPAGQCQERRREPSSDCSVARCTEVSVGRQGKTLVETIAGCGDEPGLAAPRSSSSATVALHGVPNPNRSWKVVVSGLCPFRDSWNLSGNRVSRRFVSD
jgi:hypothetical protein